MNDLMSPERFKSFSRLGLHRLLSKETGTAVITPLDQVKRYIRNGNPGATRYLNNTVVLLTGQTFYQKRGLSPKNSKNSDR